MKCRDVVLMLLIQLNGLMPAAYSICLIIIIAMDWRININLICVKWVLNIGVRNLRLTKLSNVVLGALVRPWRSNAKA